MRRALVFPLFLAACSGSSSTSATFDASDDATADATAIVDASSDGDDAIASDVVDSGWVSDGRPPEDHAFDYASKGPPELAVMFSMSWFGIPKGDRNGAGPDPSYGNWKWGGGCVAMNDPNTCATVGSTQQRDVASNYHPLAGIYSSSARDAEGKARVDLMLSVLRRGCWPGAYVDAWSVQLDSVKFSSRYLAEGDPKFSPSADLAYRALLAFLAQAPAGSIVIGDDSTWYWHFGDAKGLTTQAAKLQALEDDLVDMVAIAKGHPSALRVGGELVIYQYTGGTATMPYIAVDEWKTVLSNARRRSGEDFYVIGGTTNPTYFEVFDGIAPWIEVGTWAASTGATLSAKAQDWTRRRHDALLSAVASWPGRVVFGGIAPGFDDYTKNWGTCTTRDIPRDPAVMDAEFDWLEQARASGRGVRGMWLETWDDFTEGSLLEPDVEEGTAKLDQVRARLSKWDGATVDPTDTRLDDDFRHYGEARNCTDAAATPGPDVTPVCP